MSSADGIIADFTVQTRPASSYVTPLALVRVDPATWDRAIGNFDDVSLEQTHTFASRRWASTGCEQLLFKQNNAVVGGALMMVRALPFGRAIAIAKWAPMLADNRDSRAAQLYAGMVEALIAEYAQTRRMMLVFLPRAHGDAGRCDATYLRQRGFADGANVAFPDRYLVDLTPDETEHRKALHSKWRYHLVQAEKSDLTFEMAGAEALPAFDALYSAMTERKKFPDYAAYDTVPALLAMDDEAMRPRLFFVRHRGAIVAGALVATAGDTAGYLYGATNDDALPLRAGYFLQWNVMRWLKAHSRARWYDLGGSDGFSGLHQFKKGLIGKAGVIRPLPPVMHYAEDRLAIVLGNAAFALRDLAVTARQRLTSLRSRLARPDLDQTSAS